MNVEPSDTHAECVSEWLNQSMTCPLCRQEVTRANIIQKMFFSRPDGDDNPSVELSRFSSKFEEFQNKLCIQEREMSKLLAEKRALSDRIDQLTESYRLTIILSSSDVHYLALLIATTSVIVRPDLLLKVNPR